MNIIIKELDDRNVGEDSFNASRIIQSIEKSNNNFKQSFIQHFGNLRANRNADLSQIINQTVMNPDQTFITIP